MKLSAKTSAVAAAVAVFIGLPLLLYALGDTPRRSLLKEFISMLTLLAFVLMLGQFYLARSNEALLSLFKRPQIQRTHRVIAYTAVAVILAHPYLVVLPRHFEAGVLPWDAFVIMLSTLEQPGILLGICAWILLLVLSLTALWRRRLIPAFRNRYRGWRYFHGTLASSFTVLALWHSVDLGRHTGACMSALFITLTLIGFALLARLYWRTGQERNARPGVGQLPEDRTVTAIAGATQ